MSTVDRVVTRIEYMGDSAEHVIVVDRRDRELGTEEKLRAHRIGVLHRAVSVCIMNDSGSLLLQRRAATKYHSANLWSNTCCGHPRPGEGTADAAHRRLAEEMGLACELRHVSILRYRAHVGAGLIEHECDHVFVGRCADDAKPDPTEVSATAWVTPAELNAWRLRSTDAFSPWLFLVVGQLRRCGYPTVSTLTELDNPNSHK